MDMTWQQRQFVLAFLAVALFVAVALAVDVRVGEDVTLECRFNPVLMDKRHTFYWIRANIKEKDNVAIGESPLEKNYRISFKPAEGQYDLLVSGATYDRDNGRFECRLKEQGTGIELHSQSVDLVVLVPPSAPQINPVSPVAVEGQPTELVCSSAGGSPDPVLRWYRKGEANPLEGAITKPGGSRSVATLSTLMVRPQKEDDGSEYRCVAWNRAMDINDKKEANVALTVNYAPRVRVSPSPLNVERGGSVQIQCQVDAKPAVYSVRWTRSGRFIATSFNHTLRSVSLDDDGLYVCSADNGLGQVGEAELQLDVLHPPVVTIGEARKEVDIGASVVVPCNVSAKPAPTSVEWIKEGDAQFRSNGPVLRLNRVSANDNGRYLCRATNTIASTERSGNATFQLLVKHEPGTARISPEEPIAVDEASITLTCVADPPGWPVPQYRWWKAGAEGTILGTSSELTIHVARQNSEGTYYCQPNNDLGTGGSSYVNLRVFQPPRFIGQLPPVLQKKAQDADFNMTCSAQGKPKPSITWLKDGVEILPGSSSGAYELVTDESEGRNAIFTVRSTLRFHGSERPALSQLTADDRGVYTCAFENQIRRIESTLTLKIEHAPILLDHRPKVASNVGSSSVQLLCQVQAYPRPNFEWSLRDVPIIGGGGGGGGGGATASDSKYEMNVTSITNAANGHDIYQGVLRINDVKESDYGDYTCKMWNAEGENAAAVRLQATSAPEKPTNLRVVQSGYDSLTLEWDEAFNGGFENTIYTVLYRAVSSSSAASVGGGEAGQQQEDDCQYANPCVIRGLEQLQSYTFQVRAENTKGKSPVSSALTASTVVDLSRIPEPKQVAYEPKTKTISFNVDSQLPLMAMVESRVDGDWALSQKISVRSPVSREVVDLVKDDVDDIRIKLCLEMNTTLCSEAVVAVTGDLVQEPTKALTELPAKYMVAIIVACVVGSLVFVLFAIFYCYRRRRAQKLKKLLEMEKAHSARPTIGQQQQQQQQQQQPPPPTPQIPMPAYPSLGPVGFPGAPLMSVAALIDAGYTNVTGSTGQGKPPSNAASTFSMGLAPPRHLSDTPPLLVSTVPAVSNPIDRPAEVSNRPMIIKNEPGVEAASTSCPPLVEQDRVTASVSRSPPVVPAPVVKQEEVKVKQEPIPVTQSNNTTWSNPGSSNNTTTSNNSNSAKPAVHKLKKAWIQRHTGGDEVVVKPSFNSVDVKPEPLDRSSPGPLKMARKATASVKTEINGYGSPQNATDESEPTGLRGGSAGGKRKPRATAAANKDRDKRSKTVAAAAASAAVSATPASSTGGSSSEAEASESENDVNNGGGRTKKGGAVAALKESGGKSGGAGRGSLAGRQRNSDSSSSSKEGQPVRKGRAGGGVPGSSGAAAPGNSSPSGPNAKSGSGNPFNKPPVPVLKKSGESFLQDAPCWEVAPRLAKCRECRLTPHQRRRNEQQSNANIFCRFYAFRRLRYTKSGQLAIAGFSDPLKDASEDDLRLWLPQPDKSVQELDVDMSLFLLTHVGDQFCWMVQTEKEAKAEALAAETEDGDTVQQQIAWKRVVQGVREMCDVCETTLFNFHWACGKCGYVVCIDCYKTRKAAKSPTNGNGSGNKDDEKEEKDKERDLHGWLYCTSRSGHDPDKLMPTQIIAGKALECMERLVHSYRKQWNIVEFCDCPEGNKSVEANTIEPNGSVNPGPNGVCKNANAGSSKSDGLSNGDAEGKSVDSESVKPVNGNPSQPAGDSKNGGNQIGSSLLNVLADVALNKEKKSGKSKNGYGLAAKGEAPDGSTTAVGYDGESDMPSDEEEGGEHFSTLRELLIRPAPKTSSGKNSEQNAPPVPKRQRMETLEDVISCVIERGVDREPSPEASASATAPAATSATNPSTATAHTATSKDTNGEPEEVAVDVELVHFKRRGDAFKTVLSRGMLPPRIMVLSESLKAYPDIPHSWLCTGKLLRLHDPTNPNNYKLFQDSWKRGQPVMVSGVTQLMDQAIWHPDSFLKDFGDVKNDLINCLTGNTVPNQPMKKFWEGFERLTKRLKDDKGQPMLLKLKDWPPGDDFAELLPSRFSDLMKVLPLAEYTHRNGRLNLAGRLPECFVRPDLGPKMYNAYGSALLCSKGTTNLHLDVSDAANVMVYVGLPKEANSEEHIKEAFKAVEESGCDFLTRTRVESGGEIPGALWHIYQARDADRIRDFLNKVALERGERLEPHHDPIHDQSWYLDGELRKRLYTDYGVAGYAILQCLGDVVFIPAGAPHQVRNLHSCIKVAEDFVSPETVAHCFQLTQEFRHLSDSHTNHEDKLQIKNIIYHAMKDSIAALAHAKNITFAELLKIYESFANGSDSTN